MRTYYCDSSVFVAFFNDEKGRADIVEELLENGKANELVIVTSSFALVEVLKTEGHLPLKKEDEEMLVAFFKYPFIKIVDATRHVTESARQLIWKFPALQPKDSVHLASAMFYAERETLDGVFAYDTDFTKLNGKITPKFPITEPFLAAPKLKFSDDAKT